MRVLSLILAALVAGGACKSNPDPRSPSTEEVQRQSLGGWVVVSSRRSGQVMGELIAVDAGALYLLTWMPPPGQRQLYAIPVPDILRVELFRYVSQSGLGAWGILGTASTISHGFFLIFTAPIWVLSASLAAGSEAGHVAISYPSHSLAELGMWARFPQGLPPGLDARALVTPLPVAPPPVAPPR